MTEPYKEGPMTPEYQALFTPVEAVEIRRHDAAGRRFVAESELLAGAVKRLAEAFDQPFSDQALEDVRIAAGMVESRAGDIWDRVRSLRAGLERAA